MEKVPAVVRQPALKKKCLYCDRRFHKVEHLHRHQRSHTGKKPFKCDFCGRQYARSDVLHRHVQSYHITNPTAAKSPSLRKTASVAADDETPRPGRVSSPHENKAPQTDRPPRGLQEPSQLLFHPASITNNQVPSRQLGHDLRSATQALDSLPTVSGIQAQNDMNRPGVHQNNDAANTHINDSYSNLRNDDRTHTASHSNPAATPACSSQSIPERGPGHELGAGARPNEPPLLSDYARPSVDRPRGAETPRIAHPYDSLGSWQHLPTQEFQSTPNYPSMWDDSMMLDFLDLVGSPYFMASPHPSTHRPSQAELKERVPNELFTRVAQLWPTRTPHRSLTSHLWLNVIAHTEDNLFADTAIASSSPYPPVVDFNGSRWGVDEERRQEFVRGYGVTTSLSNAQPSPTMSSNSDILESGPARRPSVNRSDSLSVPGHSKRSNFPSAEILDMSLDQYFRQFNPLLPFIHQPTFNAKTTPSSLVFPMCLVGLWLIGSVGAKKFVCAHLPAAIEMCRRELISRLTTPDESVRNLTALASAVLLLNAAALCGKQRLDVQAHMLYTETISFAQQIGLFVPADGEPLTMALFQYLIGDNAVWKAWARVESAKSLIVSLVMLDAYLAWTLSTAPLIRTGTISLELPCTIELFEAFTSKTWLERIESGAAMITPRLCVNPTQSHVPKGTIESALGMHGLLSIIWLRITEAYHRLLFSSASQNAKRVLVPADIYATDSLGQSIAPLLIDFLSTYPPTLQSINSNCVALWHNLCLMLTTNISLFELAAGRNGPDAAKTALCDIAIWCHSPAARRACLHAAQTFLTIRRRRVSDGTMFHSEIALFNSALVLGMYVFMMPQATPSTQVPAEIGPPMGNNNSGCDPNIEPEPFEIMDQVDWIAVGMEGITSDIPPPASSALPNIDVSPSAFHQSPSVNGNQTLSQPNNPQPSIGKTKSCAAKHFIRNGGVMSFSGTICSGGYNAARRIFLEYAGLLEEAGKWSGKEMSYILKVMSNSALDLDTRDLASTGNPAGEVR